MLSLPGGIARCVGANFGALDFWRDSVGKSGGPIGQAREVTVFQMGEVTGDRVEPCDVDEEAGDDQNRLAECQRGITESTEIPRPVDEADLQRRPRKELWPPCGGHRVRRSRGFGNRELLMRVWKRSDGISKVNGRLRSGYTTHPKRVSLNQVLIGRAQLVVALFPSASRYVAFKDSQSSLPRAREKRRLGARQQNYGSSQRAPGLVVSHPVPLIFSVDDFHWRAYHRNTSPSTTLNEVSASTCRKTQVVIQ